MPTGFIVHLFGGFKLFEFVIKFVVLLLSDCLLRFLLCLILARTFVRQFQLKIDDLFS